MPPITPKVKLTKIQWANLLARVLGKEPEAALGAARGTVMGQEPPLTQTYGRLSRFNPMTDEQSQEILPIAEARAKYIANPEEYTMPGTGPEVKHAYVHPEQNPALRRRSPDYLAAGIGYERMKLEPVLDSSLRRSLSASRKGWEELANERRLQQLGMSPEDIRPEADMKTFLASREAPEVPEQPVKETLTSAMLGDVMWKDMGGAKSEEGRKWKIFVTQRAGRYRSKGTAADAKDYFVSSFNKWRVDPKGFAAKHPREAKSLEAQFGEFQGKYSGEIE